MLKVLELLTRRQDMTHEQSMVYWTQHHATIVKSSAADDIKTLRYVNNVGLSLGYETEPQFANCPYDGIVAVWQNRSFESLRRIITMPENIFVPDEPNFVRCRPYLMPVNEIVHKDSPNTHRSKLMVLFTRPHNATFDQAMQYWREQHVPRELAVWGDHLLRLTTNVAEPYVWSEWGPEMAAFDGCAEYWFDLPPEAAMAEVRARAPQLLASQKQCMGATFQMFINEVIQINKL